jgi:hypothetical protein
MDYLHTKTDLICYFWTALTCEHPNHTSGKSKTACFHFGRSKKKPGNSILLESVPAAP